MAYGKEMILDEQNEGHLNDEFLAEFVTKQFPNTFERSANLIGWLFLQDCDPS